MYNAYVYNESTYNGPHTIHSITLVDSNNLSEALPKATHKVFFNENVLGTYNAVMYNGQTYNGPISVLYDMADLSDVFVVLVQPSFTDFVFMSEYIRVEITNKALNDQIKINDWLSISRPFVEYWHD